MSAIANEILGVEAIAHDAAAIRHHLRRLYVKRNAIYAAHLADLDAEISRAENTLCRLTTNRRMCSCGAEINWRDGCCNEMCGNYSGVPCGNYSGVPF